MINNEKTVEDSNINYEWWPDVKRNMIEEKWQRMIIEMIWKW